MSLTTHLSRRSFVAATLAAPLALKAESQIPVGLELYSVRDDLKSDPMATLEAVSKMGYQCVEFYAPYFDWTVDYARQVHAKLDELNLACYSTHNALNTLADPDMLDKAMVLNHILGARYIVCAHPGNVKTIDEWKHVAQVLNTANQQIAVKNQLHAGYHNHDLEFRAIDGQLPMEILAKNTDRDVMLQLDVGTCLEAGHSPVEWIDAHPGRIRSLHLKDWSPDQGYKVLFGEGTAPWKQIFTAAEKTGGVEFYLIEQEGSRFPAQETASRCLASYKQLRNS